MKKKYPVITLCGSTRFKEEFMEAQKELTLAGNIVISVGLFGHSGDKEVWEGMDEDTLTDTKLMLDDMHKSKIDMADRIYVINPGGYIGESTWSEICYAKMIGKKIDFMESIPKEKIDDVVKEHIKNAEKLAMQQLDAAQHQGVYYNYDSSTYLKYKDYSLLDPWIREDMQGACWAWEAHKDPKIGVDPFKYYGKQKTARFVEEILKKELKQKMQ